MHTITVPLVVFNFIQAVEANHVDDLLQKVVEQRRKNASATARQAEEEMFSRVGVEKSAATPSIKFPVKTK